VLVHSFVIGELACGHLKDRLKTLELLIGMPAATQASDEEAIHFLERRGAKLWSRDKRLHQMTIALGMGYLELKH
jgi:hypothetical protein